MVQDKTALITGGGSGIGAATAHLFAANGAKVIIADVDEKGSEKVIKKIKKNKGTAYFIKTDTSKAKDCEKAVKFTLKKFDRLDIAVNNAGIGGAQNTIGDYGVEDWQKVIGINLSGVFYGMHYQLPVMKKQKSGAIVNMASILGQVGSAESSAYVAAKHGVVGLTKNAALEYSKNGIRINAVGPGYIKTPLLTDNLPKEQLKQLVKLHPIGRLGEPEEIAELVMWLCSDRASFVTGAYYNADGGYLAR